MLQDTAYSKVFVCAPILDYLLYLICSTSNALHNCISYNKCHTESYLFVYRFVSSLDYELLERRNRVLLIFIFPVSSTVPGT